MTFENQNARAKLRLELSEGVLVEVPLVVVVRAIQERYMTAGNAPAAAVPAKDLVHWGFKDFFSDDPMAMVHLVVTTRPEPVKRPPGVFDDTREELLQEYSRKDEGDS